MLVNAADLSERGGVGVYLYVMMACELAVPNNKKKRKSAGFFSSLHICGALRGDKKTQALSFHRFLSNDTHYIGALPCVVHESLEVVWKKLQENR